MAAATELLDRTVEYAAQREQFGSVIGSFQAVKHHCATMAVKVSAAQATLDAAVRALSSTNEADRRRPVDAAVAYAADAANSVAGLAQQVHGGIGFTWEHDLHLFLRRIKVNGNIDGTVRARRRALVV
ncbi:acyl-CoA dehydrogenase family protein [Gordonia aurantiaca]|uniref:acyl-CoA dehydrogenase family protein n=1 Tax=Gordonia sp. B21 TaxID=3151852 RepID=UPI0032656455